MSKTTSYTAKVKPTFLQSFIGWNVSIYVNYRKAIFVWLYFFFATYYFMKAWDFELIIKSDTQVIANLFLPSWILISIAVTVLVNELMFFLRVLFYRKFIFSEITIVIGDETIKTIRDEYEMSIKYNSIKNMRIIGDYLFLIPRKHIRIGWIPVSSFGEYQKEVLELIEANIKKANQ